MAARRSSSDSDRQLDLFAYQTPTYDTADSIRPDGRETLARVPSKDGSRPRNERPVSLTRCAGSPFRPSSSLPLPGASGEAGPSLPGREPSLEGTRANVSRPSGRIESAVS